MFTPKEPARATSYLSRLRQWWRRRSELQTLDRCEVERVAGDLGMMGPELRALAARGPHAADQLRERMHLLGITAGDVDRVGPGLMRDLQRTCSRCAHKATCNWDLATHPRDPSWGGYCPNASTLTLVRSAMHHFPTP